MILLGIDLILCLLLCRIFTEHAPLAQLGMPEGRALVGLEQEWDVAEESCEDQNRTHSEWFPIKRPMVLCVYITSTTKLGGK